MADALWVTFEPTLAPLLGGEDDPSLWAVVVNTVYPDALALCRLVSCRGRVITQLGRCSHWLRPHQTRWTADGGFAWPTGYGGPRFSRAGIPEFDWFAQWAWCHGSGMWVAAPDGLTPDSLVFRVTVPARSRRHRQAAVHTVWQPGTPQVPGEPLVQFYGFRQRSGWSCTAHRASPGERVYELAAEGQESAELGAVDREGNVRARPQ